MGAPCMIRRRLVVTGKVQGVFYRAWFSDEARALGLEGWVRNRADGSVEAVVQGPPGAVDEIVARAAEGSPASRVEDVRASNDAPEEPLQGFTQRPTA